MVLQIHPHDTIASSQACRRAVTRVRSTRFPECTLRSDMTSCRGSTRWWQCTSRRGRISGSGGTGWASASSSPSPYPSPSLRVELALRLPLRLGLPLVLPPRLLVFRLHRGDVGQTNVARASTGERAPEEDAPECPQCLAPGRSSAAQVPGEIIELLQLHDGSFLWGAHRARGALGSGMARLRVRRSAGHAVSTSWQLAPHLLPRCRVANTREPQRAAQKGRPLTVMYSPPAQHRHRLGDSDETRGQQPGVCRHVRAPLTQASS